MEEDNPFIYNNDRSILCNDNKIIIIDNDNDDDHHQSNSNRINNNRISILNPRFITIISILLALIGTIAIISNTPALSNNSYNSNSISQSKIFTTSTLNLKKKHNDDDDDKKKHNDDKKKDNDDKDNDNSKSATMTSSSDSTTINFTLTKVGYDALVYFTDSKSQVTKYTFLEDYQAVIEPGVSMHLDVYDDGDSSKNKFTYMVCSIDDGTCSSGVKYDPDPLQVATINIDCTPYETFMITVVEYNSGGDVLRSTTGKGMCLYVRREIRSLSGTDLATTMDAMHTLWTVSEEEGQETYGSNFHSSGYLLKFHHFNAAWQEGDHIHEGNGFLTQHTKMTNIFEAAMQAVDKTVSLPYWDFTIDSKEGHSSYNSAIMTESIFGSMQSPSNMAWGFTYANDNIVDAAIPDGRWAYLEAEMNNDYPDLMAGYGFMRAPWNMNPSPYVSRFTSDYMIGISLPTCTQHYAILQEETMMDFLVNIEDGPHATTHSLTGGIYGCELMSPLLDAGLINDEEGLKTICSKWVFYMKEFYRYNYIVPKTNCTVTDDIQSSECGFTCDDSSSANLKLNLKNKISTSVPSDLNDDDWNTWKDFICEGDGQRIFSGDHLESASPADPSFWVIHPTLERLLQVKFMSGGWEDESWATDPENDYVCSKSECYENGSRDYYEDCCYGHYGNDQVFDFEIGSRSSKIGDTNAKVIADTDPRSNGYAMTYIYDNFDWKHCTEDFNDLFNTMYESSLTYSRAPSQEPTMEPTSSSPTSRPSSKPTIEEIIEEIELSAPTEAPVTNAPSEEPIVEPSYFPTAEPPTAAPTESTESTESPSNASPTHKPSHEPTSLTTESPSNASPTHRPSHEPTSLTTESPSFEPSSIVTKVPTTDTSPTHKPTHSPDYTHIPTKSPDYTHKPTHSPDYTHIPTYSPDYTHRPSFSPDYTHRPTNTPTHKPTHSPDYTHMPTKSPDYTHIPTENPTVASEVVEIPLGSLSPTEEPVFEPSFFPTAEPPTVKPTEIYDDDDSLDDGVESDDRDSGDDTSASPTESPTNASPTHRPSHEPSFTPTYEPSSIPTESPSETPTESPSNASPTHRPSHEPTSLITESPSNEPTPATSIPTTRATAYPSNSPTAKPTAKPSHKPTRKPTSKPTHKPTDKSNSVSFSSNSTAVISTNVEQSTLADSTIETIAETIAETTTTEAAAETTTSEVTAETTTTETTSIPVGSLDGGKGGNVTHTVPPS